MRKKTKRLRGSKSHGRGWKSSKHKSGSRGGTGRAGLYTHKKISAILDKPIKKVTCIRDIESKLDQYIRKKVIVKKLVRTELGDQVQYHLTAKFTKCYSKILSQGQASGKYIVPPGVKLSKTTKAKLL